MGKHYRVPILLALLVTSLFLAVRPDRVFLKQAHRANLDLADRARRFLQQSGGLKEDDDVKSFCGDQEISFEGLSITGPARQEMKADLDSALKSFRSIIDEVIGVIKSGDLNQGMSSKASNIITKAPVIVLSILMLVIIVVLLLALCVYGLIQCICGRQEVVLEQVVFLPNGGAPQSGSQYAVAAEDWSSEDERDRLHDDELSRKRQLQAQQEGEPGRLHREAQWAREDEDLRSRRKQKREERRASKPQRSQDPPQGDRRSDQSDGVRQLEDKMRAAKRRQRCVKYCSYASCVASVAVTAVWFGYLARAVGDIDDVKCSIAGLKGMALSGDVNTPDFKFIGVKPLQDLLTMYQDIILKNAPPLTLSPSIAAITASAIKQSGVDLRARLGELPRLDKDLGYSGLDGSLVKPPSAQAFQDALAGALKAEALNLHKACLGIGSFSEYLGIQTAAGPVLVTAFEVYIRGLGLAIQPIQDLFDQMLKTSPRYISATQELAYVVLILLGLAIFSTLLAIALVLYYLAKLFAVLVPDEGEQKEPHRDSVEPPHKDSVDPSRPMEPARNGAGDPGIHEDSMNHFAGDGQNQGGRPGNQNSPQRQQESHQSGTQNPSSPSPDMPNNQNRQNDPRQNQSESSKSDPARKAGPRCCKCLMRLQPLKVCQAVICSVMTLLAILTFLFSIASVVGVIGFYTACEISYAVGEKPGFIDEINQGKYFSEKTAALLKNCLAPGGNGDLGALIPTGIPPELKLVMDGLYGTALAVSNKTQLAGTPALPPQGESFEARVNSWAALSEADSDKNSNDLNSGLASVNSNKCTQDSMNYKGKCTGTTSTTADTATQSLGSQYCIDVSKVPTHNYEGRYAGQAATGYCTGAQSTTEGQDTLKKTSAAANSYKSSKSTLKTKYDSFYNAEKQCFSKIKDSLNTHNLQAIYDKYQAQCDRQFQLGNFNDLLNCQSLRKGHTAVERALCYKMLKNFNTQSVLSFVDALLMLFTGALMFFSCLYSAKLQAAQEIKDRLALH